MSNLGSFIANLLIDQAHGREPQVGQPNQAAERAPLPSALKLGTESRCGAVSLSLIGRDFREVYFKTESGNIYCITKADDGRLACYNAQTGSGHYLNAEDLTSGKNLEVGQPANFAGFATSRVTGIYLANDEMTVIKLEFLALRGQLKG